MLKSPKLFAVVAKGTYIVNKSEMTGWRVVVAYDSRLKARNHMDLATRERERIAAQLNVGLAFVLHEMRISQAIANPYDPAAIGLDWRYSVIGMPYYDEVEPQKSGCPEDEDEY